MLALALRLLSYSTSNTSTEAAPVARAPSARLMCARHTDERPRRPAGCRLRCTVWGGSRWSRAADCARPLANDGSPSIDRPDGEEFDCADVRSKCEGSESV